MCEIVGGKGVVKCCVTVGYADDMNMANDWKMLIKINRFDWKKGTRVCQNAVRRELGMEMIIGERLGRLRIGCLKASNNY